MIPFFDLQTPLVKQTVNVRRITELGVAYIYKVLAEFTAVVKPCVELVYIGNGIILIGSEHKYKIVVLAYLVGKRNVHRFDNVAVCLEQIL